MLIIRRVAVSDLLAAPMIRRVYLNTIYTHPMGRKNSYSLA